MSVDLQKDPGYDLVIDKLIEVTRAGKLRWQPTAEDDTFIAAARGLQTYQIGRSFANSAGPPERAQDWAPAFNLITLIVKDGDGKILFEYQATPHESPGAMELFQLARRIALKIDEKIDSTLEVLNSL